MKKSNRSKRLVFTTGEVLHEKIMNESKALGISAADYIRMAINEKLMRENK